MTAGETEARRLFSQPLTDRVDASSVALLIRSGSSDPELASGTCLRIGDRYFIATVSHALLDAASSEIDLAYTHEGTHSHTPIERVGVRGGRRDDPIDVGYLELTKEYADAIRKTFISLALPVKVFQKNFR